MLKVFDCILHFYILLASDPMFDKVKSDLTQSIIIRLEEEVVKELVNALYHYAMTRLNPEDVMVSSMTMMRLQFHSITIIILVYSTRR